MSGHNKWSQIKRQKGVSDAKKSKIFSKFGRLLTIEAKKAGGNLSSPSLKAVIDRAKAANMPNDTIDRALKKATDNSAIMEPITYEAYGPGGVGIIIEALTDNRNKAAQEIKFILSKHSASLAGIGAASWAFTKSAGAGWTAQTTVPLEDADIAALEKLVDELEENDEVQEVFTNAE